MACSSRVVVGAWWVAVVATKNGPRLGMHRLGMGQGSVWRQMASRRVHVAYLNLHRAASFRPDLLRAMVVRGTAD